MTILKKQNFAEGVLFFLFAWGLSFFFFTNRITLFPISIHAWTQSDRYALVLGFLNNGLDFFHPQTFNLVTVNGITQVDFPIHEYIVALIMKISGFHEPVVFRMYTLGYGITGLYFLFRFLRFSGGTLLHSLFGSLFILTLPVFTFFLDGFLPSIPSFANCIIGYYFFFRYRAGTEKKYLRTALLFFTLAALARTPFAIFLFAGFIQQVMLYLRNRKLSLFELKSFAICWAIIIAYYFYNYCLGKKYGSQFLLEILPPKNVSDLSNLISLTIDGPLRIVLPKIHFFFLLTTFVCAIGLFIKKGYSELAKAIFIQSIIAVVGFLFYFILMAQQFPHHEYYFIDSFYPAIALMLAFSIPAINLIGKKPRLVASIIVSLAMAGFIYSASGTLNSLYQFQPWDRNEITRQNFINTDKYLDSIGVARTSKVLVLDSYNTNAALTLMNRKGYTVIWTKKENIEEGLSKPFDIVAIQNCFIASDVVKNDSSIITQIEKFADNGLVSFYQRKNNPNQTFNGFFGITKDNTLYNFASDFQSDSSQRGWSTFILSREKHFSPPSSVLVDVKDEFSPTFEMKSNEINLVGHAKILLTGKILRETNKKQEIVASLKNKDENYYYMNFAIQDYTIDSPLWQNFMFQFVVPELKSGDDKLSIYFWNPDKGKFYLDDMALTIYK